ncbi:MAG: NAD(P)/FAD-dependent oxidoreductase [Chloroflexota bacterium]|nr:NAD(P)/FAD-dependent oxidoreductase [Chloroflexota bacterium]MDE2908321.1 NAD(P)/FAD-dependent oxidoreductase [Chloroflexota bacterium]
MAEYVDVLIVGTGISGIAAGYYVQKRCPHLSWTIVESRAAIGGTWDFFRYPGVRSDSDMYTLGYRFRPWTGEKAIADGSAIRQYICDTAREFGIDQRARFSHRVCRIDWSSQSSEWTVEIERPAPSEPLQIRCNFLFMCTGYYRYDRGYTPEWRGMDDFAGDIVHPQAWGDLDYAGKRVIVIGSGATAVTIVPALARKAAHVTMLQRSPSYVASLPAKDPTAARLRKRLPFKLAAWLMRWRQIMRQRYYFHLARSKPQKARDMILDGVRSALGPDYDVDRHFSPRYNPWDERLCLVPDNDLFNAIKSGAVSMATDRIERFVNEGIRLESGEILPADIIVTATGMRMRIMDGVEIIVDGDAVELGDTLSYKGIMFSNIPNLALSFGYSNASWTLKCELICEYVCRLLNYMERRGYQHCVPRLEADSQITEPMIDFTSGYVRRALPDLPKQGTRRPWKVYQNYLKDLLMMRYGRLNDGVMEFK